MKISVIILTVTERHEILQQTLGNLQRSGIYASPFLGSLRITTSERGKITAQANAAAALSFAAEQPGEWVLFLEDDIDVINGFLDAVGQWLLEFSTDDRRVYSFSVPHPSHTFANGAVWDYPIKHFCCTQAFAVRHEDARSLAKWLTDYPFVIGPDGNQSTGAYDLSMRAWAKSTYPGQDYFSASVPSFVQHMGNTSLIRPDQNVIRIPSFPGRDWVYAPPKTRKRRLLWIGDAACQTGFARNTHGVLHWLQETWDIAVLGINYKGDPHPFSYPIYPCLPGGDFLGFGRTEAILKEVRPDVVVIQNDTWHFPGYFEKIQHAVPTVGVIAVDGKNCRGDYLQELDHGIFWTQFGLDEARAGGFTKPASVIPIGIDQEFWCPGSRDEARKKIYKTQYNDVKDAFILLNINRNQERKRFDLTLRYFAEWIRHNKPENPILHLHVAPTGDINGYDCQDLARYYGILDNVIFVESRLNKGPNDYQMRDIYRAADLGISTTQGEGWGLTTMEGFACGLPAILPDWSALGEWARPGAWMVPCTSTSVTVRNSVIGGVIDEKQCIEALQVLYADQVYRRRLASDARALAAEPSFRWKAIGAMFNTALETAVPRLKVTDVETGQRGIPQTVA